jgi:hypothetical protein
MTLLERLQAIAAAATHYRPGLPGPGGELLSSEPFLRVQGFEVGERAPSAVVELEPGLFQVDYTTDAGAHAWRMLIRSKVHFRNAVSEGQLDLLEGVL